jgi:hypothetical protein
MQTYNKIPVQNQTRHNAHTSSASATGNWKTPHQGLSIRKKILLYIFLVEEIHQSASF